VRGPHNILRQDWHPHKVVAKAGGGEQLPLLL
jgi:hypothetical protein